MDVTRHPSDREPSDEDVTLLRVITRIGRTLGLSTEAVSHRDGWSTISLHLRHGTLDLNRFAHVTGSRDYLIIRLMPHNLPIALFGHDDVDELTDDLALHLPAIAHYLEGGGELSTLRSRFRHRPLGWGLQIHVGRTEWRITPHVAISP